MSKPGEPTRAQALFLQAFKQNPAGPAAPDWPAPALLRRWLQNDTFRQTLADLRDAYRLQADFHIAAAAATAARTLQSALTPIAGTPPTPTEDPAAALERQLKSLTGLLRLAHLRQRFCHDHAASETPATPRDNPEPGGMLDDGIPNPNWFDRPRHIANIFCDPDKNRLKSYLLLLTMQGVPGYEPFLAAFPDELEAARRDAREHPVDPNDPHVSRKITPAIPEHVPREMQPCPPTH